MTPRVRLIVSGAATAVILALVVFGLWAFTAPSQKHSTPPTIQLSPAELSQKAYKQGLVALSDNQTDTAKADFKKAVDLDPNNTEAKKALDDANRSSSDGSSSNGSSSTGSNNQTTTPAPPSVWVTKLALKPLLPASFTGYQLSVAAGMPQTEADVLGTADNLTVPVGSLEWSVLDQGTAAKAKSFLAGAKKRFNKDAASVTVNDVTAHYGVNSQNPSLATCVYVRGRYVFEVLATSDTKKHDQALTVKAASAFAVKP